MVAEGGEGENPFLFSLTAPKRGGGSHLRSSRFSRHPRLRQAFTRRFAKNRNFVGKRPQALGGPGPKPHEELAHRPLGPGSRRLGFLQACYPHPHPLWFLKEVSKVLGPGSRHSHRLTSCKPAAITPNPLHSPHERRGSRLRSSISAAGPGPKVLRTWPTSPPVLIGS